LSSMLNAASNVFTILVLEPDGLSVVCWLAGACLLAAPSGV
jgi:hypothetical protein